MRKNFRVILLFLFVATIQSFAQKKPVNQDSLNAAANAMAAMMSQDHIPRAPQSIQTPNAAGLGAYGEIPVSLYTGKPQISVDLHTISEGNVTIPISLDYDASGVRPDVHGSWTGLNFNLSTNYSVTRTIRDGPDEFNIPGTSLGQVGYLFTATTINNGANWALPDTIRKTANANSGNSQPVDTEPDEYSFNLPGLSGKFYFGSDGKWKVQCDRPVSVERITTSGIHLYTPFTPPSSIQGGNQWNSLGHYMEHVQGFVIVDEFGTRYTFGGSDMAYMEYSIDFFNQGQGTWICNSWNLKSIIRHTGQVINFTYERGDFVAQMFFSVYNKTAKVDAGAEFGCANWSSLIGSYGAYNGKLLSPLYLKEISGDNFKVKYTSSVSSELGYTEDIFTTYVNQKAAAGFSKLDYLTFLYDCYYPTPTLYPGGCGSPTLTTLLAKLKWRKLDKIEILNSSGTTIKEFGLTYINNSSSRLMLDKVQQKSGIKVIPPYQFTYFSAAPLSLPGYSKSHTDHWGYNNGLIINTASDFSAVATYGTNFRSPATDVKVLKLGSLASISYPTGGVSKFIMEPHSYTKEVKPKRWDGEDALASNQRAGGLRVKEIHSYDNATSAVVSKRYYYLSAFNAAAPDTSATALSSGILGGKAQYYFPGYKPLPDDPSIVVTENIFSTQSVLPVSENSMGSHLGYSQVIERSSTQGWTVHQFTNFDNGYRDDAPSGFLQPSNTPYQPCNSKAFMRGKLLTQSTYLQNGTITSKNTHTYSLVGALSDYSARSVKTDITILCTTGNHVYEGTAYLIDVRKFLPAQDASISYDQQNVASLATNVADYTYWQNGQLYINAQNDSRARTIKTWFKYPPNFSDANSIAMTTANIIATPLEVFKYTGTEAAPSAIKLQTVTFDLFSGHYLPKKVESKLAAAAAATTDIDFLTYDARGNLLTYKEKNGVPVKLDYFATGTGKTDLLQQKTLANGGSNPQSTSYDYKPLVGVQSIADANAKTITYEYDEFNRLITVKSGANARASYCYNYANQLSPCTTLAPTGSIAATTLTLIPEGTPPLPVTLVAFDAVKSEKVTALSWSTTEETGSDHFDIERSRDGKQWTTLGSVDAMGESNTVLQYSFSDHNPMDGENLYRLKMTDKDSTFSYSRIRSVTFGAGEEVSLFPNPITIGQKLNLVTDDISKISSIKIFDTSGKLVNQSAATMEINTSQLAVGLYVVQITFIDGSISTHRVVKQ